jgi:two-component system CheB/CheR fusion protein
MRTDLEKVLNTLIPIEREVVTEAGHWFLMRINPYRTLDNVIEGAVISFTDIGKIIEARELIAKSNDLGRMAVIIKDSFDAVTLHDLSGSTLAWNRSATRLYGWSESEALGMNLMDRVPQDLHESELENLARLSQSCKIEPYLSKRLTKEGKIVSVSIVASNLQDDEGYTYAIATTERLLEGV